MKADSEKNRFVKACPKCFSLSVSGTNRPMAAYREFYDRCLDCGFEAKSFPEFFDLLRRVAGARQVLLR